MKKIKSTATPSAARYASSSVTVPSSRVAVAVPNRELLHRINFLHQAAVLLANATHDDTVNPRKRKRHSSRKHNLDDRGGVVHSDATLISTQPDDRPPTGSKTLHKRMAAEVRSLLDEARQDSKARSLCLEDRGYTGLNHHRTSTEHFHHPVLSGRINPGVSASPHSEVVNGLIVHTVATEQPPANILTSATRPTTAVHDNEAAATSKFWPARNKRKQKASSTSQTRASVGIVFPVKYQFQSSIAVLKRISQTKPMKSVVQSADSEHTGPAFRRLSHCNQMLRAARTCAAQTVSSGNTPAQLGAVQQILDAHPFSGSEGSADVSPHALNTIDPRHLCLKRDQIQLLSEFIVASGQGHLLMPDRVDRGQQNEIVLSRADKRAQRRQAASTARRQLEMRSTLPSIYGSDVRAIARKAVLRLDPSVKRQFCRNCNNVLVAGVTSTTRIKASATHVNIRRIRCLACGQTRMLPSPPIRMPSALDNNMDTDRTTIMTSDSPHAPQATAAHSNTKDQSTLADKQYLGRQGNSRIAPGSPRQHVQPRFHERSMHVVTIGNARS